MDLDPAQALIAGNIAQQTEPAAQWLWGRWDGQRVYLGDAPTTPLVAENAAGDLPPTGRVFCLLADKRVTILGPVKPIPESASGRSSDGWWHRSPDGMQICWQRVQTTSAATTPYGGMHLIRHLWTYPAPFIAPPAVTVGRLQLGAGAAAIASTEDPGTSSCILRGWDVAARSQGTPLYVTATAVGRWRN
uniref:Uncharacterized protein n=1 Tax=Dulem virus 32 TaxID=3145750 RepID=A0AAU8B0I1_9CAUD